MTKKHSRLTLLRAEAISLGIHISAEKDGAGVIYWLSMAKTGDDVWKDGNSCAGLDEVDYKLDQYRSEIAA